MLPSTLHNWRVSKFSMLRRSATPLLIGTFILRLISGAGTVVLGLFLAQLTAHGSRVITSFQVGLLLFTPTGNPLPYLLSLQMFGGISSAMQVPSVLGYLADFTAQDPAY